MSRMDEFRNLVEGFLAESGMAQTTLGAKALGDPNFVRDLRGGKRSFNLATVEKVERFIADMRHAPAEAGAAE